MKKYTLLFKYMYTSKCRMIEEALQHTNCIAIKYWLIPGGRLILRLYIPGGNTSRRENFDCKHVLPCLEVQRLRDFGMLAELGSKVHNS